MIKLLQQGEYRVIQTLGETRLLDLGGKEHYAWILAPEIGEILVITKKRFAALYTLARGKFRLYDVKKEPKIVDTQHLELYVGEGFWQGYILPTGLPKGKNIRNRIIPTKELITQTIGNL